MALTAGMLVKFRSLVSEKDDQLLRIRMERTRNVYGYLREVGAITSSSDEVKSVRSSGNLGEWPQTKVSSNYEEDWADHT